MRVATSGSVRGRCDNSIMPSKPLMRHYLGQHRVWSEVGWPAWCCTSSPTILRLARTPVHLWTSDKSFATWETTEAAFEQRVAPIVPSWLCDHSSQCFALCDSELGCQFLCRKWICNSTIISVTLVALHSALLGPFFLLCAPRRLIASLVWLLVWGQVSVGVIFIARRPVQGLRSRLQGRQQCGGRKPKGDKPRNWWEILRVTKQSTDPAEDGCPLI